MTQARMTEEPVKLQAVAVIGAGPAGLGAALELCLRGTAATVLEKADKVGGIARTEVHKGCRFDVGGHRFHTRMERVESLWRGMLGEDLLTVRRLSRILHGGELFRYPLDVYDTLRKLGLTESALVVLSYLRAKLAPRRERETLEQWLANRFGNRLYRTFFKTYSEKVWGMPCSEIRSDWAAQRIGSLSVGRALQHAVFGRGGARTLISEFLYPVNGAGMMWERIESEVRARGGEVLLGSEVTALHRRDGRIVSLVLGEGAGAREVRADHVVSTMPLPELVGRMRPAPPEAVLHAARGLRHRDFILVGLIMGRPRLFPDNWIYVHEPSVRVGRVQNYSNFSPVMAPDLGTTSLGMEYFCNEGDGVWTMPDAELVALAAAELEQLGLGEAGEVRDGFVIRQPMAYPVYDRAYQQNLLTIRGFLSTVENLQTAGRNGLHRYNNMDHSMLTGTLAAENVHGARHDLWRVDTDGER